MVIISLLRLIIGLIKDVQKKKEKKRKNLITGGLKDIFNSMPKTFGIYQFFVTHLSRGMKGKDDGIKQIYGKYVSVRDSHLEHN